MADGTVAGNHIRPFDGIIVISGAHDVGKTIAAFETMMEPGKSVFIDDDVKGSRMVAQLENAGVKLLQYHNLTLLQKDAAGNPITDLDYHKRVVQEVFRKIPNGCDTIIVDTWTGFAGTCHTYVTSNPSLFRKSWSPMGQIKGAQEWQAARDLEAGFIAELKGKCRTLVLVVHLKDYYENNKKIPGKQIMAGSSVLSKTPNLRMWLRRNPKGTAVPMALILKRIERVQFVPGEGLKMVSVLPTKVVPLPEETSLWQALDRYWQNPVGNRALTEDEIPTAAELAIINNTLTEEQQTLFRLMLEHGSGEFEPSEGEGVVEFDDEETLKVIRARIEEARAAGALSPRAIADKTGLTIGEVIKYTAA